jgi:predicted flap endonuclease-1-like 5' DNA nuclease
MDQKTAAPMSLWTIGLIVLGVYRLARMSVIRGRSGGVFPLGKWLLPIGLFFLIRWVFTLPERNGSAAGASTRANQGRGSHRGAFDIPVSSSLQGKMPTQARQGQSRQDDLREIEGIGPAISERLQRAGIHTFRQLAETDPARLNELLEDERLRNITNTESWPEQARLADRGDWEGLRAYKERLKGGRQV